MAHAVDSSNNRPAGVDQSIFPAHQFLVKGIFARANSQKVERLLDEPVGYFRIEAEPPGQRLIARAQDACFFANEQTRRETRFAPGTVHFSPNWFHGAEAKGDGDIWQSHEPAAG